MNHAAEGAPPPDLVAGPYRSGTNDDPELIARNVHTMADMALPLFRSGHLPVLGEWFALSPIEIAGSKRIGDAAFDEIFIPFRAVSSPSATPACASLARRKERMKW